MKKLVFALSTVALLFVGWTAERLLRGAVRYEWSEQATPGAQATAITGSLTRGSVFARVVSPDTSMGLSLNVKFRDGVRFTWIGDASMVPIGLVERADGVYLVLQEWSRPHSDVKAGKAAKHQVCHVREPAGGSASQATQVTPLFVPSDVPTSLWPWVRRVRLGSEFINKQPRVDIGVLTAQTSAATSSGLGACPDLRRADHL